MKNILNFLSLIFLIFLTGCEPSEEVRTSEGESVSQIQKEVSEICYKEVVYVKFGEGNGSWGGVKFDKNGKIVTCEQPKTITNSANK